MFRGMHMKRSWFAIAGAAILLATGADAAVTVSGSGSNAGSYSFEGISSTGFVTSSDDSFDRSFAGSSAFAATGMLSTSVGAAGSATAYADALWTDTLNFRVTNGTAQSVTPVFLYFDGVSGASGSSNAPGQYSNSTSVLLSSVNGIATTASILQQGTGNFGDNDSYSDESDGWITIQYVGRYAALYGFNIYGAEQDFSFRTMLTSSAESYEFFGIYIQADAYATLRFVLPENVAMTSQGGAFPTLAVSSQDVDAPMLPGSVNADGGFQFDFVAVEGETLFFDPEVAVGYDYVVGSGAPNIATALFPTLLGDADGYEIYAMSDMTTPLFTGVMGGQTVDFATVGYAAGIAGFALRGIDVAAGLDPADTAAFVTGLSFVSSGIGSLTQTPVTILTGPAAVPEPATWAMMILGLGWVGAGFRRRKAMPASA
jgi:hypothetical protein